MRVISWLAVIGLFATASLAVAQDRLAKRIDEITGRPEYKHGRWGILVVETATGRIVVERNADQMFVPASTTKLYSSAHALAELGPDHRFVTHVYVKEKGPVESVRDLVLVASGDPTLGGRDRPDGTMAFRNSDHIYADETSKSAGVTDSDPLAGLKQLAKQVYDSGIRNVSGDVLIDDRLFDRAVGSGSGPRIVSPIIVNDNLVDFIVEPGKEGGPAVVKMRPETGYVQFDAMVTTRGDSPDISVVQEGPRRVSVRGHIPAKSPALVRIWPVDDAAAFARCLFIECLRKQGVGVSASPLGASSSTLPRRNAYENWRSIAEFRSLPFSEVVKVTLKVSHNLYASEMPLLVAAKHGERTLKQGMKRQGEFLRGPGLDMTAVSFAGGAGGSQADSTTPRATVSLLQKFGTRPEFAAIEQGMPVLGVDGTLAESIARTSPARGHVRGKTGTLSWNDLLNGGALLRSKALAGTMTTASGKKLIYALFVNDVQLEVGVPTAREGRTLAEICEAVYLLAQ